MSDEQKTSRKRPVWVWVISIFFFISAGWTLLSFYLIWSGVIPLAPAQKAYFDQLTLFDYGQSIVVGLLNMTGAVALFLLRRIALAFFLSGLGLGIISVVWHAATKGWIAAIGGPGLVGVLLGYVIVIAVCAYVWRLSKTGVLR
jgi:hypothetical protein